jgi:hypothetical protein
VFGLLVAIGDLERVSDTDIVSDFVKGKVVGMPVLEMVRVGETVYELVTVIDLVFGYVLGIPV